MAGPDDHGELTNRQTSGNRVGGEGNGTPRTILGVGGSGGLMSYMNLALDSLRIMLCSGSGRVGKRGVHVGRRRRAKHQNVRSTTDTTSVGGINGKLHFL